MYEKNTEKKNTEKKKDSKLFLLIILIVVIGAGLAVFLVFFNKPAQETTTDNNATTTEEKVVLPSFTTANSKEAFAAIKAKIETWATDAKVETYSGLGSSLVSEDKVTRYGAEKGAFQLWSATVYSPKKGAEVNVMYRNGEVSMSEELKVDDFMKKVYQSKKLFDANPSVVDSDTIYNKAIEQGMDLNGNYHQMYLMFDKDGKLQWSVQVRSLSNVDAYGTGNVLNTYYFDAFKGDFVTKK